MAARVIWTVRALGDLDQIAEYISHDSERYAAETLASLLKTGNSLQEFPSIGRRVAGVDHPELRELIEGSYRIIYRLRGNQAEILAVVHGARDFAAYWEQRGGKP